MSNLIIIFILYFFSISRGKEIQDFKEYGKYIIKKIINNTYNESNICEKSIYSNFQEESSLEYLINSSSLECNDITPFFACQRGNNTNFYVISFKPINPTEERIKGIYDINYIRYGICIHNISLNCTELDIKEYLIKMANKTEISNGKIMRIFNMNNVSKIKIENIHILLFFFFGILSFFIFLLGIIPIIPLFECCFLKKKSAKSNDMKISIKCVDKVSFYNFCKCFSLEENTDYLTCSHVNNKSYSSYGITNDEGLGYIKGIFGLSLTITLFGFFYIHLLSAPYKNYDKQTFENMFYNPFKCLINLSARYGPRILFSCSGYIFMFKFSCFLEDQITEKIPTDGSSSYFSGNVTSSHSKTKKSNTTDDEISALNSINDYSKTKRKNSTSFNTEEDITNTNINEEKFGKETRKKRGSTITNIDRLMTDNFNQIFKPKKKDQEKITIYSLFIFYRSQLYKLILIIFAMLFVKFVLFIIFEKLEITTPSLISFRNNFIDGISFSEIFGRIFQYLNFKIMVSIEETANYSDEFEDIKNMGIVFLFWPIICELFFFIFTTPIVFTVYKLKKDPLFILLIIAGITILLRIILFIASSGEERMYSTLFYYAGDFYGLFSNNPIMNYSSFLIGCIFGYFYFLYQRIQYDKEYLKYSNNIVYFLRYQNKFLYYVTNSILTFIILIFVFFEQIYFYVNYWLYDNDFSLYDYLSSYFVNYLYLIDNDLFLCILHYLMFSLFCKNEKFLIKYLSKDVWENSLKYYLSFSLFANYIVIFIMQKTQTKINIHFFSILYYGILSWCILFFVTFIFAVLFEIPFKRVSHLIFKNDDKIINEKGEKEK